MNIQRIKQGARINYYNGIYMIIFGIFYAVFVGFNIKFNFNSVSELWGFFSMFNPEVTHLFYYFNILIGLFLISTGIVIMHLADFICKRKEKMTWMILFFSGAVSWGGLFVISILLRNWILIILSSVGVGMFLMGIFLPIKYYLGKRVRTY